MKETRNHYTQEEKEIFISRAKEFMQRKPGASRSKIAVYSGTTAAILERLQEEGNFRLPEPLNSKQQRNKGNWGRTEWSVK